jgi:tetratricopeptide (TPR) repeat protein
VSFRVGDLVGERFSIDALAGRGGMGSVFRATDRTTSAHVALKALNADAATDEAMRARFLREARVLASMDHPAIVRHVEHGITDDGVAWLAMEWLEGETLAARLKTRLLDVAGAVALGVRVARALEAAHAAGVVHRDVKPSNIVVAGQLEDAKLVDFGVARHRFADAELTTTGLAIGTANYMAPEQARGVRTIDGRADLYALGGVLFKALTGTTPFAASDLVEVLAKVLLEPAPSLRARRPEIPVALDELVRALLAKEPESRPATATEVIERLDAIDVVGVEIEEARATEPPRSLGRGEQRMMTVVLAARAIVPAKEDTFAARDDLGAIADAHGARVEILADGSVLAVLADRGPVTDLAARAARCALAMHAALPSAPMAMATGRGDDTDRLPEGEVVERAAAALRDARAGGPVHVDDVSAGLVAARFEVAGDGNGLAIVREHEHAEPIRPLLGKTVPCVGRERELVTLASIYDQCVADDVARAALVIGAAGMGKSRIHSELLRKLAAHATPPQVWIARGDERTRASTLGALRGAIRDTAGIRDGEAASIKQQKLRARVARNVAEVDRERVATFLGELVGADFDDGGSVLLQAARRDAMIMGDQVRAAWHDFVRAEADAAPLLIVLEDLHWADARTVALVDATLRSLADRPLMVLALARPDVRELFPNVWAERDVQEIRLAPLTTRAATSLVRAVLGDGVSEERASRMVALAAGNALALEELVRAAASGSTEDVPATVAALAQARFGALEEESRRVLRAGSVFGQSFWSKGVASLLGEADLSVVDARLAKLEAQELVAPALVSRFAGEREWAFRHALSADAAYAALTEDDRRLGHRLAGAWLERAGERDAIVVANHFDTGGDSARAAAAYVRAAEQALGGNDFGAAIERADRAAACGAEGELLGRARYAQTRAHLWRNENELTRARAAETIELVPRFSDVWCDAYSLAAGATTRLGDRAAFLRLADALEPALDESASSAIVAAAAAIVTNLSYYGESSKADAWLSKIGRAEGHGAWAPDTTARVARARAMRALADGNPAAFVELSAICIDALEAAGSTRSACLTRANASYGWIQLGYYDEAERLLIDAMRGAVQMDLVSVRSFVRHNYGYVLLRLGRLDEAERMEREAIVSYEKAGDERLLSGSRQYLALVLLAKNDLDGAAREARLALATCNDAAFRTYALASLAQVLLARGEHTEALEAARESAEHVDASPAEEAEIRLAYAEALEASHAHDEARTVIALARDRILARAAKIPLKYRDSFLERVPEHARTVALAAAWFSTKST